MGACWACEVRPGWKQEISVTTKGDLYNNFFCNRLVGLIRYRLYPKTWTTKGVRLAPPRHGKSSAEAVEKLGVEEL